MMLETKGTRFNQKGVTVRISSGHTIKKVIEFIKIGIVQKIKTLVLYSLKKFNTNTVY